MWYINQECLIVAMKVQLSRQWTRCFFIPNPIGTHIESKRVRICPNFLGENKQKNVETCNFHFPFLGALYTFMCFKTNCMCLYLFWETENCQKKTSKTTHRCHRCIALISSKLGMDRLWRWITFICEHRSIGAWIHKHLLRFGSKKGSKHLQTQGFWIKFGK